MIKPRRSKSNIEFSDSSEDENYSMFGKEEEEAYVSRLSKEAKVKPRQNMPSEKRETGKSKVSEKNVKTPKRLSRVLSCILKS